MKPSLQIRSFRVDDLDVAVQLREEAEWNQTPSDWKRLFALNPSGCFVGQWDGKPVGTLTTTIHGEVAWIGMVLVASAFRRRGIAKDMLRHSLAYLRAKKVRCVKLDATPKGLSLYRSVGFKPEWKLHRWEWEGPAEELQHHVARDIFLRALEPKDLARVKGLDRRFFGADRSRLLQAYLAGSLRASVWDLYSDLESYGMMRPGAKADYLGPVASASEHHAQVLIRDLISHSKKGRIYWDIPDANRHAKRIAESLGFKPQRCFTRMYRGRNSSPGEPEFQYAIGDPATG